MTRSSNGTWLPDDDAPGTPVAEAEAGPGRYQDLGPIGAGAMGEVRRVLDRQLGRVVAMKIVRAEVAARPGLEARFRDEIRLAAQLQHPVIVPVYDSGITPEGRLWFTMKEVRGRTLAAAIEEAHGPRDDAEPASVALRRLLEAFRMVCEGVGYAHARGVLHRDLKPDNVMLGAFGEVHLLDWGIAKIAGSVEAEGALPDEGQVAHARHATRVGTVLGTPAYMAPEQLRGEAADARTDIFALGAILWTVLHGRSPTEGAPEGPEVDRELQELALRAMADDPAARFQASTDLAAALGAWLDGSRRREQALAVLARAEAIGPEAEALVERSEAHRARAAELIVGVRAFDPESRKAPSWAEEDRANELARRAERSVAAAADVLQGALQLAPDLEEVHVALIATYEARHREAEAARRADEADRLESLLAHHAARLPSGHPVRRDTEARLRGDGRLTLVSDPPGATVELYRYTSEQRRAIPVFERVLGQTPLREIPLPMGSYLCVLSLPGRATVRYPVLLRRLEHADGVDASGRAAPVLLPPADEVGDGVVVPAGWFISGGDPEAFYSLPGRRLWCDGFVLGRFPVTLGEYLAFLDDLAATGGEAEAVRRMPRTPAGETGVGRDSAGRFVPIADSDGDVWQADWPVICVDWSDASAYAAWLAARTGLPWRLPSELEWEKAARGVDGRVFPWGGSFDASRCCAQDSREGGARIGRVGEFPLDESPYGVRDLAGNVADWCLDAHTELRAALDAERPQVVKRLLRGGQWSSSAHSCRAAHRAWDFPSARRTALGFRLARSLGA